METRANLVTVGLFVLLVIAAGFVAAFWLLRGNESDRQAHLTVLFPGSVSGLVTGASVTFNGIKVGQVTKLSFAPDDPSQVIAQVMVDGETPIKRDAHVSLGYQGLTGLATVQIWGGSQGAERILTLDDKDRLMWAERSSVQDIIESAQRVLGKVDGAVGNVEQLIKDNSAAVGDTVRNVKTFSDALARNSDGVDRFLASMSSTGDALTKVGGRIETLTADVDELVRSVDRTKITSIVDHADAMVARLDEASKRVDGILAKIDGIAGSDEGRGVILKAGGFLDEATAAAKSIKETANSLQVQFGEITAGVTRLSGSGMRDLKDFVTEGRRTLGTIDRAVGNFDRAPNRVIFGGQGGSTPEYQGGRR
ncbi:MCE family protein [Siculibacillus lacustris]|uniref:MCE family protein n=1 Tax=Siculibacillus lacustris TaxID=1549641 RepID=A0A4Q9VS51_9HYPH|nr:MlaD family protein [Siculibacillus lacustris]TBW38645.1 MCE family protein [Siculibacillus lacustris]